MLEGKVIVARNATTHGIFAAVPVLPGESADEWEGHRTGVVESLAPVGLLEVNLAERAALLLWRLQRLARYEAEMVASAMEDVEVPVLPPPEAPISARLPSPAQPTREDQLWAIRDELRTARQELAEVTATLEHFESEPGTDAGATFAVVNGILKAACERAETADDSRSDPPAFGSKGFMRKLGLPGTDPRSVAWTPDLIRCGLVLYASFTEEPVERVRGSRIVGRGTDAQGPTHRS